MPTCTAVLLVGAYISFHDSSALVFRRVLLHIAGLLVTGSNMRCVRWNSYEKSGTGGIDKVVSAVLEN